MGAMSPWHWAIVLIVLVLLFGSKKLPDAARGLGRSLRIFKSEMSQMQNEGSAQPQQTQQPSQQTATQPEPQPQPLPPAQPAPAPQQQHVDPK